MPRQVAYKYLEVYGAEADDIIATLVKNKKEPIMIVSGDKDFIQLHRWGDTAQWSPVQSKWVRGNPDKYLREHILKGDRGDGIPNILSKDDTFVNRGRQTPLRQKKIDEILADLDEGELLYAASWYGGYCRNQQLIDLEQIPSEIRQDVVNQYRNAKSGDRSKMFNYFIDKGLSILMQSIKEFIPTDHKVKYLQSLVDVGFDTLDVGSFVSSKVIPQLSDTSEVIERINLTNKTKLLSLLQIKEAP